MRRGPRGWRAGADVRGDADGGLLVFAGAVAWAGGVSVGIARALFDNEVLDANAAAILGAATSDVVLLAPAGTSYDQFKDFAERGDTFRRLVAAEKTK